MQKKKMNKKQTLLVTLFSIGIIFVISGLELNTIRAPMTNEEIGQYKKELSKSKWCQTPNCPSPPFFAKLPYQGIGQTSYYIGTVSLVFGSIISIRNNISISRQFSSYWIFFVGTIMTSVILAVLPIRIPQIQTEPFCIDPLCPIGGLYFTTDPSLIFPLLYSGIAMAIAGGVIYLVKSGKYSKM
jgi:hypothetical protein